VLDVLHPKLVKYNSCNNTTKASFLLARILTKLNYPLWDVALLSYLVPALRAITMCNLNGHFDIMPSTTTSVL
jgi:hypothetical protein